MTSRTLTRISSSGGAKSSRMIAAAAARRRRSGIGMTCGRTVAICGRNLSHMMVAMMLPPKAGRVCIRLRLVVDVEAGAVGGQAGLDHGGHRPGQVAADAGGAHQDDLRLVPVDQVADGPGVGLGAVVAVDRRIEKVGPVGAAGEGFGAEVLDLVADDHGAEFDLRGRRPGPAPVPRSSQETLAASPSVCSMKTQTPR